MKISNTLPAGYYKASTESGFYFWDGFGANKPNEVKGRLLLIGCYDMSSEQKFGCVKYASTENLDLNFTDASSCSSRSPAELKIDGIVPEVNDRILLKDQTSKSENGIYIVTKVGSVAENFELKRASDANAINALASGKFVFVTGGNSQVNTAVAYRCVFASYEVKLGKLRICFCVRIACTAELEGIVLGAGKRILYSFSLIDIYIYVCILLISSHSASVQRLSSNKLIQALTLPEIRYLFCFPFKVTLIKVPCPRRFTALAIFSVTDKQITACSVIAKC